MYEHVDKMDEETEKERVVDGDKGGDGSSNTDLGEEEEDREEGLGKLVGDEAEEDDDDDDDEMDIDFDELLGGGDVQLDGQGNVIESDVSEENEDGEENKKNKKKNKNDKSEVEKSVFDDF